MKFVDKLYTQTLEVKKSKFIAFLLPYDDYQSTLQKLKDEHQKARHFVTAYRHLNQYNQIIENSSDDGEPKGTSGKPSLFVLQGAKLINSAVIIVRYFGGIKLGTGGLVRAYSDAVNLVLHEAKLLDYKEQITKTISFTYSDLRMIEYECQVFGIDIIEKEFDEKLLFTIKAPQTNLDKFFEKTDRILKII